MKFPAFLLFLWPLLLGGQPSNRAPLPPAGIPIPEEVREKLESGLRDLQTRLQEVPLGSDLFPDAAIFAKAVEWPLRYHEFYRSNEFKIAESLLAAGLRRADQIIAGKPEWNFATGLVVRAYRSRVDDSLQPYGLVIPAGFVSGRDHHYRLDCWFHGRDETLTELKFIDDRQRRAGEFAPTDTFVLHLYGRYCNASKFAGETDLFEALADVLRRYPIDPKRIAIRGFSMGGASAWHLAVHHAGLWRAAAPGAGFAESPRYLKLDQALSQIPWWEQKLWHLYNATDYAANLFQCPVIAYSGEIDPQRQAADFMAQAMKEEGLDLPQLIGPGTAHKYEPGTKTKLIEQFDALMARAGEPVPDEIRFTTWTLRYPQMHWIRLEGLKEHWTRARVDGRLSSSNSVHLKTTNVTDLELRFPFEIKKIDLSQPVDVEIDGRLLASRPVRLGSNAAVRLSLREGAWRVVPEFPNKLRKKPGLCGPIDDAFFDRFIFVSPTGHSRHREVDTWIEREEVRAIDQWRRQFRGEVVQIRDVDFSEKAMRDAHVVLWGTPESNVVMKRALRRMPMSWTPNVIQLRERRFDAATHALLGIYPAEWAPDRYVIFNSGFTFRGFGSNADQTPKLPDFAVINILGAGSTRAPGPVAAAGFFDEAWNLPSRIWIGEGEGGKIRQTPD